MTAAGGSDESEVQRGGLREAQRRFTRQHILDAARAVFVERGFIATSVEDIIERAGTSRRTFYAHFRSKTDVLAEIGRALVPEIQNTYRRLDDVLATDSRDSLREWFESTMEWCERNGSLTPVWEEAAAIEAEPRAQRRELVRGYVDFMPAYLASWPEDRREEARLRVVLMTVQIDRFLGHWPPQEMGAAERERVPEVLTSIWHDALRPPAPGGRARSPAKASRTPKANIDKVG
jgi:AcrR family transcriptional regulator